MKSFTVNAMRCWKFQKLMQHDIYPTGLKKKKETQAIVTCGNTCFILTVGSTKKLRIKNTLWITGTECV